MKFLVDAQLPKNLSKAIKISGFDCIHTLDLPEKNKTTDSQILFIAEKENRVLITKDSDFFESYVLKGKPKKLLFVSTGNISNKKLKELFLKNFNEITNLLKENNIIELTIHSIIVH